MYSTPCLCKCWAVMCSPPPQRKRHRKARATPLSCSARRLFRGWRRCTRAGSSTGTWSPKTFSPKVHVPKKRFSTFISGFFRPSQNQWNHYQTDCFIVSHYIFFLHFKRFSLVPFFLTFFPQSITQIFGGKLSQHFFLPNLLSPMITTTLNKCSR